MKTIQKVLITILIVVTPTILTAQKNDKNTETVKFITSIDCDHCVNKITTNLQQEKGISDVKCELKTKEVAVTYQKDKKNPEEIKMLIEKLGFTANKITSDISAPKKQ